MCFRSYQGSVYTHKQSLEILQLKKIDRVQGFVWFASASAGQKGNKAAFSVDGHLKVSIYFD